MILGEMIQIYPVDTQPKLNLRKTFMWRSGRHVNALGTFILGRVSIWIFFGTFRKLILPQIRFRKIDFCLN